MYLQEQDHGERKLMEKDLKDVQLFLNTKIKAIWAIQIKSTSNYKLQRLKSGLNVGPICCSVYTFAEFSLNCP